MSLCECGCGGIPKKVNRFIHGHNSIGNQHRKSMIPWNKGSNGDYMKGDKNHFYGKHHSEESIQRNRDAHIGKLKTDDYKQHMSDLMSGTGNPMFGKVSNRLSYGSYYESPLQGKVYLRSSYEIAYAKYLDEHKISWMYEMKTFDLGDNTYTPDFFLIKENKFIEIKGYMSKKAQIKIDKFLEQYTHKLEILKYEDLIKLGLDVHD